MDINKYSFGIIVIVCLPLSQVYGHKDADGFYRGECAGRTGFIPCNMVSELRVDSDSTRKQLLEKGHIATDMLMESLGTLSKFIYLLQLCQAKVGNIFKWEILLVAMFSRKSNGWGYDISLSDTYGKLSTKYLMFIHFTVICQGRQNLG